MPYASTSDLPDSVKAMPTHAQEIYRTAFNAAYAEYKDRSNQEALAHATAWTAVKKQYKKQGDKWVAKEAKKDMTPYVPMAVKFADEEAGIVESIAAPFDGPFDGQDIHGEHFSKNTDFCLDLLESRPAMWQHGLDPTIKAEIIGKDIAWEVRDVGLWVQTQLNKSSRYWEGIKALIKAGKVYRSTMAIPHLKKVAKDGEILVWPWVETTFTVTPANYYATVGALKAIEDLEAMGIKALPPELAIPAEVQELYFKIAEKEGAPKSPPKGYPTDPKLYGDPKNFKYPLDEKHINAAVSYFNHDGMQKKGGYSDAEWATIGKRIAAAANKLIGPGHSFSAGKIVTKEAKTMEKDSKAVKADVTPPEEGEPKTTDLEEAAEQVEQDPPVDDPGVSQGMAPETHVAPTDQAQTDGTKAVTPPPVAPVVDPTPAAPEAAKDGLSTNDIREALYAALQQKYSAPWGPGAQHCFISDVFNDGTFVFGIGDAIYRMGYTAEGEAVTLTSEPVQVIRRTVYDPAPVTATGKAVEPAEAAKATDTPKPADQPAEAIKSAPADGNQLKAIVEEAVAPFAERIAVLEKQPAEGGPMRRLVRPEGVKGAYNPHIQDTPVDESVAALEALLKDPTAPPAVKSWAGERLAGQEMRNILNKGPQPLSK